MTKQDLQKELLEKVKPGTKPSQLKRSKSASDLPKNLQPAEPRRKSLEVLTNPNSLKVQLENAQDQIATLSLKLEVQERELTELNNLTAENSHLKKQAKIQQQQREKLSKDLIIKTSELTQAKQELDKSLEARYQGLKDWSQERVKRVQAESELNNLGEESAEELVSQDQLLTKLRNENFKLKQTNQTLQKDLSLSSRLAEMRKVPYFENDSGLSYFKYAVYALLAISFGLFLKSSNLERRSYDL